MSDSYQAISILAVFVALYGLVIWFLVRILHRMGFSGWWAVMIVFWPIGLGLLAFSKWPAFDRTTN